MSRIPWEKNANMVEVDMVDISLIGLQEITWDALTQKSTKLYL